MKQNLNVVTFQWEIFSSKLIYAPILKEDVTACFVLKILAALNCLHFTHMKKRCRT